MNRNKLLSKKDAYSPFKVVHHLDKIQQIANNELPTPCFAQIDLTNVCNLACTFCFYKGKLRNPLSDWDPKASIPYQVMLRTLDNLKVLGVKALEWTGGGSVECHPYYKEILQYANEIGFEQALVTSGTLLDDEAIDIIKDFSWVRFSIDASTEETYLRLKGRQLFDKAIQNLAKLLKIKSESNVVGFSFVAEPLNYKEILDAVKLAKELGCDNARLSLAMTPKKEKLFDGIWGEVASQFKKSKQLETNDFSVFEFSNRIYQLSQAVLSDFCVYHHLVTVISPTGVYPCCRLKDNGRFNLGNISDSSFAEIWFGERRQEFIKSIERGCPFDCWMTRKNRFATYIMKNKKNVKHANFV